MIPTKSVLPSKVTFRVQGVRTRVCLGCSPGLLVECVSLRLLPHGEQYRGSRSPPPHGTCTAQHPGVGRHPLHKDSPGQR